MIESYPIYLHPYHPRLKIELVLALLPIPIILAFLLSIRDIPHRSS